MRHFLHLLESRPKYIQRITDDIDIFAYSGGDFEASLILFLKFYVILDILVNEILNIDLIDIMFYSSTKNKGKYVF